MKRSWVIVAGLILARGGLSAAAEAEDQWGYWRGPWATGVAPRSDAPLAWSATEKIKWRLDVPGLGFSTPIVWEDKIFLTSAVPVFPAGVEPTPRPRGIFGEQQPTIPERFMVLCVDRATGAIVWERVAIETIPHEGHHSALSSYANASPVTDGERVYVNFGSRGLYAYDLEGNLLWSRDFGVKMRVFNRFGESCSPALYDNTLVLQFDHDAGSFAAAVDKRDGSLLWRIDREENTSWTSPHILVHDGRPQVVLNGTNFVRGHDLATGDLIWKFTGMTRGVIPTPVSGLGMVFVASGTNGQAMKAVRLGGSGDLTGTPWEVWGLTKGTPYNPTPLLWGEELYLIKDQTRGGTFVSCFNARTGEAYYEQARLPQPYTIKASPVGAGDKIYLLSEEGDAIVLRRGPTFEVLSINPMGEMFLASPAVAGGELYLRSRERLYCVSAQ